MKIVVGLSAVLLISLSATLPLAASHEKTPQGEAEGGNLSGLVVGEQGSPLEGADVIYSWWTDGKNKTVAARTDANGRFVLQASGGDWSPGEIWAGAKGHRLTHKLLFQEGKRLEKDLRLVLPPPAQVEVAVTGPDGKPVSGARINLPVIAFKDGGGGIVPEAIQQVTESITDRAGKAIITACGRGELSEVRMTTTEHGIQSRYLAPSKAEESQPLKISLRAAGRVRGRVVAPEANLVDGIGISLMSYPSGENAGGEETIGFATATTDKEGRFEISHVAAGVIRYINVERKGERPYLPDAPDKVALGVGQTAEITIAFKPAVRVQGIVREAITGKPFSGVMVAVWETDGSSSAPAMTRDDGAFDFLRLPGSLNLYLQFSKPHGAPAWFSQHYDRVPGGKSGFELPPIELALARGRVVDQEGRGIAGAKIERAMTKIELRGQWVENPVVWYTEPRTLATDDKGEYRAWVEVGTAYRLQASIDGRAPQWTEWVTFKSDAPAVFPDLVIESLQSVAGRVVDRQGKPVAGVTVFQSGDGPRCTEATTDDEGRFRLDGYQHTAGYLFAEKDGFRFHGQPVTAGASDVNVALTRTDEKPPRLLTTLAEIDPAADRALAMRVLRPAIDRLPMAKEVDRWVVLRELAQIDPAAVLDRLEALNLKGPRAAALRAEVAKQWAEKHPDDTVAIVEALGDAYSSTMGYVQCAEALPASLRRRKLDWLGKARVYLRGVNDPTLRIAIAASIARSLAECGDAEQSRKVLAELRPDVEKMPLDGFSAYARGAAAEALATSDLPAALSLIKDLKDDREYNRHHGNIARIVAATNPAGSLLVLKLMRDDFQRDQYAVYAAHRMAPVDRVRADEVVELISRLDLQAHARGLLALALLPTDTDAAREELDRAYALLAKLAAGEAKPIYGYHAGPVLAAWLLPLVEKLRPDEVEEHLWRALSSRVPLAKQSEHEHFVLLTRAHLAMFVARYDRKLARDLYGDLPAELAKLGEIGMSNGAKGVYAALAMIDPASAVALYEKLPDDLPYDTKSSVRGALVSILSKHGEARWRATADHLQMPLPWHEIQ